MKDYKYYIFDMDLTLLNTLETATYTYIKAFESIGKVFDPNTVTHHLSISLRETFDEINDNNYDYQIFFDAFIKESARTMVDYSYIYQDGLEVVKKLHEQGKILGIVTNRTINVIEKVLKKAGIYELFFSIITGDKVTALKPSPEPLEKCLLELGASKEEAIYIGDAKNDYHATLNANMDFIAIERYDNCKFGCPIIIHSLLELLK